MYALDDYKKHFEDCQRSLSLAKKIMSREEVKLVKPSQVIKDFRGNLLRLFSSPEFYKICHQCKGLCCRTHNFPLRPIELLCFVAENPCFEFPEPDWQFLEKGEIVNGRRRFVDDPCLFLSEKGCILREYRPLTCLAFFECFNQKIKQMYSEAEKEKIFYAQMSYCNMQIETFCEEILRVLGISKKDKSYTEIKGEPTDGAVGFKACLEALEKLAEPVN